METAIKTRPIVLDKSKMTGKWELTVKINNPVTGARAFGGRFLTAYRHPLTNQTTHLKNSDGQPQTGYVIEKLNVMLRPDDNPDDKLLLEWLLGHPEVLVEGVTGLDKNVLQKKVKSPGVALRNLDNQYLDHIDEEDVVDQVVAKFTSDSGPNSMSIKRLRYLLAAINLPYFDRRYINNPKTEKKVLRNKIKSFCRSKNSDGVYNAVLVKSYLDELDQYEINYYVKEMLRVGVLVLSNGSIKYNNYPIASNDEGVIVYFQKNVNLYMEALKTTTNILRQEGFDV